jgi:hypothetical protein
MKTILLILSVLVCSAVASLSREALFDLLTNDTCNEVSCDYLKENLREKFEFPLDGTGLDRTLIQVAVDKNSHICLRKIFNCIVKDIVETRRILKESDKRGWLAIHHALRYQPELANLLVPYELFVGEGDPSGGGGFIEDLARFAYSWNGFSNMEFLLIISRRGTYPLAGISRERIVKAILRAAILNANDAMSVAKNDEFIREYCGEVLSPEAAAIGLTAPVALEMARLALAQRSYTFPLIPKVVSILLLNEGADSLFSSAIEYPEYLHLLLKEAAAKSAAAYEELKSRMAPFVRQRYPFLFGSPYAANDVFASEDAVFLVGHFCEAAGIIDESESHLLFGFIPLSLYAAVHNDKELLGALPLRQNDVKLIACYAPKSLNFPMISDSAADILNFVLFDGACRAKLHTKRAAVSMLSNLFSPSKIVSDFIDHSASFSHFSESKQLVVKSTDEELRGFLDIIAGQEKANFSFAAKLIDSRPGLDLSASLLLQLSTQIDNPEACNLFLDLQQRTFLEPANSSDIPRLHNQILQKAFSSSAAHVANFVSIVISKLWIRFGVNHFSSSDTSSVYTFLLSKLSSNEALANHLLILLGSLSPKTFKVTRYDIEWLENDHNAIPPKHRAFFLSMARDRFSKSK